MLLTVFTIFHVLISVVAIFAGVVFTRALLSNRLDKPWTAVFLLTTIATSVTGFLFPVRHFMPSHGVGIVSLLALGLAVYALYHLELAGRWRATFVISAITAFYLNVFVGLVQAFAKIAPLKHLAPTQTESPFKIAQLGLLILFIVIGAAATIRFRGAARRPGILS